MGRFMVHMQGGSVFHLCTKFEANSSIRSKVIRGSENFKIGSRDHKPRPFWTSNVKFVKRSTVYLRILAAKFYACSLILWWVMDESNVNGPFYSQNKQCACALSRDRVVEGHPKPHICNQQPQFAYSIYNFYGATMTIKGSLHCKAVLGRKLSSQNLAQK